jgi:hypothetical protein
MCLNANELKVLKAMGFHASSDNGKQSLPFTERGWSRRFGHERDGVTALLYVKKTVVGFEYRVTLSNANKPKDHVQWFDAEELRKVKRTLGEMTPVWKKARRALEGGLARRALRKLIKR